MAAASVSMGVVDGNAVPMNLVGLNVDHMKTSRTCVYFDIDETEQPFVFRYYELVLLRLKQKAPKGETIRVYVGTIGETTPPLDTERRLFREWLSVCASDFAVVTAWAPSVLVVVKAREPLIPAYDRLVSHTWVSSDKLKRYHLPTALKPIPEMPYEEGSPVKATPDFPIVPKQHSDPDTFRSSVRRRAVREHEMGCQV